MVRTSYLKPNTCVLFIVNDIKNLQLYIFLCHFFQRNLSRIYVMEKVDSWRVIVQHIATAMLNRAQLPDIPGINQTDKDNLSIALGRFRRLGKTYNTKTNTCIWYKISLSHTNNCLSNEKRPVAFYGTQRSV
jgi:hypothetical protein